MNIKINPIILIFLCYAIGIISLFLPQPLFFGIILLVPAVIGTIYFYAKRIIRIYGEKNAKIQEELNSPISKIQEEPEKIFEQPKVIEIEKLSETKLITVEEIKDISNKVKEIIDDSMSCKKFISKVKLPVSSSTTINVQITPEIFLVISVKPNEIVVYRYDESKENKSIEKTEVKKVVEIEKPVEIKKLEPKSILKSVSKSEAKLTYPIIIEMVLKNKGKLKVEDALSQCKKLKNLKQWERLFPMANSRLKCPVVFSYVEENGIKTKYVEWVDSK